MSPGLLPASMQILASSSGNVERWAPLYGRVAIVQTSRRFRLPVSFLWSPWLPRSTSALLALA